jgi:hypothetical protein
MFDLAMNVSAGGGVDEALQARLFHVVGIALQYAISIFIGKALLRFPFLNLFS